jgi:bifunctional UDP-N-acetylglucosamine pyrophosphorylase/glucosamine-1-phosphate N-acetyltransferase
MPTTPIAALVLAAGKGTRMKSTRPKVLHQVAGKPMVAHVLAALAPMKPQRVVVVVAPGMDEVAKAVAPAEIAVQTQQRGTGDAVAAAKKQLGNFKGDVLVLYGDAPLVTRDTLNILLNERKRHPEAALVVLGMRLNRGGPYGRLLLAPDGSLDRIVEAADATEAERAITLCNSGIMLADGPVLFELVSGLGNENAKGEYYLTDIVALARSRGLICRASEGPSEELLGVNSPAELASAEAHMQKRLRAQIMATGVTLVAPETVYLSADTRIGPDSVVGPFVVFGPGVKIGMGVTIPAFCHIAGATIGDRAVIGPFARLRPGAALAEEVHIGNFVEVKNARLAKGVKANHLSYLGDASVGEGSNIGAGSITCNYDGIEKFRTNIGKGVFVGTNSSLVAPLTIGPGAMIAAGSVITHNVPADALALGRGRQETKPGLAKKWRAQRKAEIAAKAKPKKKTAKKKISKKSGPKKPAPKAKPKKSKR